jgi:hypothetical protein
MDLQKMIAELQAEKERLDAAIEALERLTAGKIKRRGRPPRWLADEIQRQSQAKPTDEDAKKSQPTLTEAAN